MNAELTPWARGALTEDQRLRLRLHLAGEHRISVMGTHHDLFIVKLMGPAGQYYDWQRVPKDALWYTIEKALAFIGQPLESDEDWERTKGAIHAVD